jgi:hypothetical protein
LTLDQAAALVRRGLDARKPRIVFPRRLAWLLRLADLLPPLLGDAIMNRFRFHIAEPPRPTDH